MSIESPGIRVSSDSCQRSSGPAVPASGLRIGSGARGAAVDFLFEGRRFAPMRGESVACALFAAGIRTSAARARAPASRARHVLPDGFVPGMRRRGGRAARGRLSGAGARGARRTQRRGRRRAMTAHASAFDLVVIGGGPAGIMAAVAARRHGATVALLDENPAAGGQVYRATPAAFDTDPRPPRNRSRAIACARCSPAAAPSRCSDTRSGA